MKTIIITAGIHGDEPEGLLLAQQIRGLDIAARAAAVGLDVNVIYHGMMNPTGFAAGVRENADGVDLNRKWSSEGNSANSAECTKAWADIVAARESCGDDVLVIDCHSMDATPGVYYAGQRGKAVADKHFSNVARIAEWSRPGTLTHACESIGVTAIAVEVTKGEGCRSVGMAVGQALKAWSAG